MRALERATHRGVRPGSTCTPTGLVVGAGFAVVIAASIAAAAAFSPVDVPARTGVLVAVVGGFAAATGDAVASAVTTVFGWLFLDGFLVDSLGELRWHGHADLVRMALLAGGAVLGWSVNRLRRGRRRTEDVDELHRVKERVDGRRDPGRRDGGGVPAARPDRPMGGPDMSVTNLVGLSLGVVLTVFLVLALLFPERF